MRRLLLPVALASALVAGCAAQRPPKTTGTLAQLDRVAPDLKEAEIEQGLDQAMQSYKRYLEEAPKTAMTPEAMRRLADLHLEKQFGIHGAEEKPKEMAAPEPARSPAQIAARAQDGATRPLPAVAATARQETDQEFEQRTTAMGGLTADPGAGGAATGATRPGADPQGARDAIALYKKLLAEYPNYEHRDKVLYQMARAYDELGRTDEAIATMERLIQANPNSEHYDEVEFRRGEYFFTRRKYFDAQDAYAAIINLGPASTYYELALYKLGWTYYKQQDYEEALKRYVGLLDYKVSTGYDFDQTHEEDDERRVADTFRAISLSFSNLGGPDAVRAYFSSYGARPYEDRVYGNLGAYYLDKLRYDDAAKTYRAFIALYPYHRSAPIFSMRIVDTFTKGGFPKLVLEAKRDFATRYGLKAEYWQHVKREDSPEVLTYLKTNLKDLANHYHAQYQGAKDADEKAADYREAHRWFGEFLESFPEDAETPAINYQFADLLLEHKDFGEAARQYERTAYEYPANPKSAAAGYAAIYAHREELKVVGPDGLDAARRETVASSLRFADGFPQDEHAAPVLGAAADDQYEMKDYKDAVATARRLIDNYPGADPAIRRAAWTVVAHGSFELAQYPEAEQAYDQVLAATPQDDKSRPGLVDDLAASIYKQGEVANEAQDYRTAAEHFMRIRTAAPTSKIRPTAEYDAGAALIRLKDWAGAVSALQTFRSDFPDHKLHSEATKQIAYAYREGGQLPQAAAEYERLAGESKDPTVRSESLLVAGDLYQQSKNPDRALEVYTSYIQEFPQPIEPAVETHFKIAQIHKEAQDDALYRQELKEIVRIDAQAGTERTDRTRTLAGRSALVLAEPLYQQFAAVKLRQPFEASLQEKQQRMDATIKAMEGLVSYEIAEVTAAATYYMAETYFDFSRSLKESERPPDLQPADLKEYEQALDEEARPFEEKAIGLHEKNIEMLHTGVFNKWIEKSLGTLATLRPERFARQEERSGFLDSIDRYEYQTPAAQAAAAAAAAAAAPADDTKAAPGDTKATKPGDPEPPPPSDPADQGGRDDANPR